jgi:hypothetical protein
MNRFHPSFISALIVVLFTGCVTQSGQVERDALFSASSDAALFIFGVDLQSKFKSPDLIFRKYDPLTGKVDKNGSLHVTPRIDKLTSGQKFNAAMSGQSSRPGGHDYFVINLAPGDWFLWAMSGFYNDGLGTSYSSTTYFSKGTFVLTAKAGVASYIGEFVVRGSYGENMILAPAPANFAAAQAELRTFTNVTQELVEFVPKKKTFSCTSKQVLWEKVACDGDSVVVSD